MVVVRRLRVWRLEKHLPERPHLELRVRASNVAGAIQTKGRRTMLAKFLGWMWIVGLIAAAAVIITRLHAWEAAAEAGWKERQGGDYGSY